MRPKLRTLILCGGRGTRAYPQSAEIPKPLLDVGGRPILLHVIEIFAAQGYTDFVLAAGFKAEAIREFAGGLASGLGVEVVDTGEDAETGERVFSCRELMGESFFLTYADGVGNVDLQELRTFHEAHDGSATVTI